VDRRGALYVADARANCVKAFTPDGRWLATFSGAGPGGALFDGPRGLWIDDAGRLHVADTNNNRVVQLLPDGELGYELERFAAAEGAPADEELYEPRSVCGGAGDLLWVADTNNNRVLAFGPGGVLRVSLADGLFDFPSVVRTGVDGRTLYVADHGNLRVQRFDHKGSRTGLLIYAGRGEGEAAAGGDVDVDGSGQVALIDPRREAVVVLGFKEP
jgi:DNA-binding beta-propeller fold protein YncE